jgi:hypothetical protein
MNLATFGKRAVARYEARHREADDVQYNTAAFTWNAKAGVFEIEVRGYVVARHYTLATVKQFCAMHNNGVCLASAKPILTALGMTGESLA